MTIETVWEERISALAKTIDKLTAATDRLAMVTERVSVLEEKHQNQGAAVGRAFGEIGELRAEFHSHEDEARKLVAECNEKNDSEHQDIIRKNSEEHKTFSRYIWVATGFCSAAVVFWSLFGYRLQQAVDEQMKIIAEVRLHMYEDKVKTPEDVRMIHKSIEAERR